MTPSLQLKMKYGHVTSPIKEKEADGGMPLLGESLGLAHAQVTVLSATA